MLVPEPAEAMASPGFMKPGQATAPVTSWGDALLPGFLGSASAEVKGPAGVLLSASHARRRERLALFREKQKVGQPREGRVERTYNLSVSLFFLPVAGCLLFQALRSCAERKQR